MGFVPVPDVAEVVMEYTLLGGNKAVNVFNVREAMITSWTQAILDDLIDIFSAWETNTARALRSNQVILTGIRARDMTEQNGLVVERAVSITGTIASAAMPANVTLAIKANTGFAGRSFRGRSYWIGLTEANVTGDFVATTAGNQIVAGMNTLRTNIQGSLLLTARMVVVSRVANGAPRQTGIATDITSWSLNDYRVDTQRRRLLGVGS
jgi:hypothetical protein